MAEYITLNTEYKVKKQKKNNNFFFFNDTATTEIYTLSLHDALPISPDAEIEWCGARNGRRAASRPSRSEEHTSELQSRFDLVCRLLLEKKKGLVACSLFSTRTKHALSVLVRSSAR